MTEKNTVTDNAVNFPKEGQKVVRARRSMWDVRFADWSYPVETPVRGKKDAMEKAAEEPQEEKE